MKYKISDVNYEITCNLCNIVLSLPMHAYLKEEDFDVIEHIIKENVKKG